MTKLLSIVCSLVALAFGCDALPGCGGEPPVAELLELGGEVRRDRADARGEWEAAGAGARFAQGDGVRTGEGAWAVVRVRGKGRLRLDANTVVRFSLGGPHREGTAEGAKGLAAPGIEVEQGEASLEASEGSLRLRTLFGTAVLEKGTKVRLSPGERGVRFEILMGSAAFQHEDGESARLEAGQAIEVGIGMAVLEDPAQASPEATQAAADEAAGAPDPEASQADGAAALAVVKGRVRRRGVGEARWTALAEGPVELRGEVELDVDEGGSVEVSRGDQRATLHGEGRYRLGGEGGQLVDALDGRLSVVTREQDVRVRVPGGSIVARGVPGGTRAALDVQGESQTLTVRAERGTVQTRGDLGERTLEAGEEATLGGDGEGGAEDALARAIPEPGEKPPDGFARTLPYADVTVAAGETFRVYDPSPPAAIGFAVEDCEQGAELRLRDGRRARGEERISLPFKRGPNRYAVHCLKDGKPRPKPFATGGFRVVPGDGTARLPRSPPDNHVTTDGRSYTIMYQNLKPRVHVSWPDAPPSPRYVLHLQSPRGADRKFRRRKPRHRLLGRLLSDGKNVVFFTAKGGESSPRTTLELVFDNAAPAASIKEPPVSGFRGDTETTVRGVAVTGSKVAVAGIPVPLDAHSRFRAQVPLRPGQRALAIRFKHRRHGVRYYLRRRAGIKR